MLKTFNTHKLDYRCWSGSRDSLRLLLEGTVAGPVGCPTVEGIRYTVDRHRWMEGNPQ